MGDAPQSTDLRLAEIRARLQQAKDAIKADVKLDGNKLTIGLEFEDEGDLVNRWIQAVADCNSLLCILDGGTPV
jgi:hypothetical protein